MNFRKRAAAIILTAAVSMSSLTAMSAGASAEWVKSDSGYSYKSDTTGKKLTGWQTIDGGKYYFDKNGYALTGWVTISGDKYYFNPSKKGKALTGWATVSKNKYYFGNDGVMRTGWIKLNGKTYYMGKDGVMRTGKVKINGKTYDFGTDGVMKTSSSSSSSSSSITITSPKKGISWGASSNDVIKAKKMKTYTCIGSILICVDSEPYTYYLFNNDSLCLYGYMTDYSKSIRNKFVTMFKDEGWKCVSKSVEDDSIVYLYKKGDTFAALSYNDETCVTMVFPQDVDSDSISDALTQIIE